MTDPLTRVSRVPLAALGRLGGADLVARFGLRPPLLRAVQASAKAGMAISGEIGKRLGKPHRLPRAPSGDGFDLTPTEEQTMMCESAKKLADEVLRPAAGAADTACTPPREVLVRGHELALAALAIPERFGGMAEARSPLSTCLVAEQLARGDLSLAAALLAPIGVANALVDWGTAAQQERWLPRFVDKDFMAAAIALLEPHAGADPMQPRTGAVRHGRGWRLHGEKALVPLAETAELLLVVATVLGAGPRVFLVERDAPGLEITRAPAMGLRAAATARIVLRGVTVGEDAVLGGRDGHDHAALVDGGRLAWAALAVGAGRAVVEHVVPYCNDRVAFGEPISHRQAVAFAIANLGIELDGMRLATWRAAALAERGKPFAREAARARHLCATRGMQLGNDGVQLLGGHGFVKEHPVERWYRDLRAIAIVEGGLLA